MAEKGRELKTRCFVLRKQDYKETSLIVDVLSFEYGKITIMAKGVRKENGHWAGILDILNELDLILYKNPESQWYIFISGLLVDAHLLDKPLEISSVMQAAAELYRQIDISQPEHSIFFDLIKSFLDFVVTVKTNHILIFWRFLLRFLNIHGIDLDLKHCVICNKDKEFTGFYPQKNGFICDDCSLPELSDYVISISDSAAKNRLKGDPMTDRWKLPDNMQRKRAGI